MDSDIWNDILNMPRAESVIFSHSVLFWVCKPYPKQSLPLILLRFVGENKDNQSLGSTEPMIDWTPSMDRQFIDVMLEQVRSRNMIGQTFDDQDWADMTSLFNEKLGLNYSKRILENRYVCLTNQYIDVSNLLEQSGFAWDETQQIIAAEDDVWEAYIKVHFSFLKH